MDQKKNECESESAYTLAVDKEKHYFEILDGILLEHPDTISILDYTTCQA